MSALENERLAGFDAPLSTSDGSFKLGNLRISTLRGLDQIAIERDGGEGGWFSLREFYEMVQEFVSDRL